MSNMIDNRKIAKNTFFLYIRMFLTMAISLYTSRVIINTLGVDDFGIYNLIAGIIVLFGFVSTALRIGTQRFLSFELGKVSNKDVGMVFNASLCCHYIIIIFFFVLAETLGLWLFDTQLNIPADRLDAAKWVFHFSVLTFGTCILQVPFHAAIISYEKMSFYAEISIIDVVLKLAVVFMLALTTVDKLIMYAIMMFCVGFISVILPAFYCYKHLNLPAPRLVKDGELLANIFKFSGWSMLNSLTNVGAQQGGNILINIFYGVAANGAFGIANQVSTAVNSFVSNFQSAFNPQIVKSYSANQFNDMLLLVNRSALFSFYLLLLITMPILTETNYILEKWLGSVPSYSEGFCQLMLLYFLVDAIQAPLWMLIGATGRQKVYTIWAGGLTILNIPISWLLLKIGLSVYMVFVIRLVINIIIGFIRPIYVKKLIPEFSILYFFKHVLSRGGAVLACSTGCISIIKYYVGFMPLINLTITIFVVVVAIVCIGISKAEREFLKNLVITKYRKYKHGSIK